MAVTIASSSEDGPILAVAGVGATPTINTALAAAEAGQPEGAQLTLTIDGLGAWAGLAASRINAQYAAGAITDPASGEAIQAWPGATTLASVGANDALVLQWVKGQPWAFILVGLLIAAIVAFAFYEAMANAPWKMTAQTTATGQGAGVPLAGAPMFGGQPFRVFWLPWYWAAVGVGVLAAGPWVIERVARGTESVEEERQALRTWEAGD